MQEGIMLTQGNFSKTRAENFLKGWEFSKELGIFSRARNFLRSWEFSRRIENISVELRIFT